MPTWARLSKTSKTKTLGTRMSSALENGYGDEGPLAKFLAIGGCFGMIFTCFLIVVGIILGVPYGLWVLGHLVF